MKRDGQASGFLVICQNSILEFKFRILLVLTVPEVGQRPLE